MKIQVEFDLKIDLEELQERLDIVLSDGAKPLRFIYKKLSKKAVLEMEVD
jgi:hypothetical protein